MKLSLGKALALAAVFTLVGCQTYGTGPSEIEKRYYAECATNPPTTPCGNH
jgi:hypothetical protein